MFAGDRFSLCKSIYTVPPVHLAHEGEVLEKLWPWLVCEVSV